MLNYEQIFLNITKEIAANGLRKKLLLSCCCAPCSTLSIERLLDESGDLFDIYLHFYNPNIDTEDEYYKRAGELEKLKNKFEIKDIIIDKYDNSVFLEKTKILRDEKEGGKRCDVCFELRLTGSAVIAKKIGADYFCTTLTVSPHKNSDKINIIGSEASKKTGVEYLYSDFKKKDGFRRSAQLSDELKLYRQTYCGCVYTNTAQKQNGAALTKNRIF